MQAFEVGHLRRVAGFDQGFEPGGDQGAEPTAERDAERNAQGFTPHPGSFLINVEKSVTPDRGLSPDPKMQPVERKGGDVTGVDALGVLRASGDKRRAGVPLQVNPGKTCGLKTAEDGKKKKRGDRKPGKHETVGVAAPGAPYDECQRDQKENGTRKAEGERESERAHPAAVPRAP